MSQKVTTPIATTKKAAATKTATAQAAAAMAQARAHVRYSTTLLADIGLGDFRKYIYGAGAVLTGFQTASAQSKGAKVVFGAGTLGLTYLALAEPERCASKKKVAA